MHRGRCLPALAIAVALVLASPDASAEASVQGATNAASAKTPDRYPGAGDSYLVAVDGRVLWARKPDLRHAPASLTKLLVAVVALERGWNPEDWIVASPRAVAQTGSRAGLRAGEAITAGDALAATLVASSNDACVALAEHVAGSVEAFLARMNARAAALGLAATHVASPCGLDAPGHLSTARDVWRLTQVALAYPTIRALVAIPEATIRTREGRTLHLRNGNALLGRLPGTEGVKTGYTRGAGRCIVALVRRDQHEVLLVLLGAPTGWPDRWWSAAAIVEAAFSAASDG